MRGGGGSGSTERVASSDEETLLTEIKAAGGDLAEGVCAFVKQTYGGGGNILIAEAHGWHAH